MTPLFSVIVPAYNAERTLAETLDAVAAQEHRGWECIVVDDGSTDGTAALAQSYAARDLRYMVLSQSNQGTAGAYNTGVRASHGQLVVICSADDLLLPDHLSEVASFTDANPEFDIYSSNGEYLYDSGERRVVYRDSEWSEVRSLQLVDVLACCFFSVGATFRRGVFDLVGGYRLGVYGEDYDFWLRAIASGARHLYLPRVLSVHRVSVGQKSADLVRVYESNIEVYRNLIDEGWVSPEQASVVETAIVERQKLIESVRQEGMTIGRADTLTTHLQPWLGQGLAARSVGAVRRGRDAVIAARSRVMRLWRR